MNATYILRLSFFFLFTFTFAIGSSRAATHVVTSDGLGDYATIQEAIDAVAAGDTIYLGDGTFSGAGNKDLDTAGKNLVIMPLPGAVPVIDCEDSGRAFYIHSSEDQSMVIKGLTLTGGNPPGAPDSKGGAIRIEGASPTITDNKILENQANYGAGIHLVDSNSMIVRNQFIDNTIKEVTVSWGYGGGVYAAKSIVSIYDNHFEQNEFSFWEAVYILSGNVSIENNSIMGFGWMDSINNIIADSSEVTIVGNHIKNSGGCIWLFHCTATVRANYFQDSNALAGYGGVFASNSTVDIDFNYFEDVYDGAIDWAGSSGDIYRNVITGSNIRSLDCGARAVYVSGGTLPSIFNNTFYENGTIDYPECTSGTDIHIDGTTGAVYSNIFVNSVALDHAVVCGDPPWAAASEAPARQYGNLHWGNTEESIFFFCDAIVSLLVEPMLCDPDNDNFFLTEASPNDSTLVGALPPGCSNSDVLLTEVPPDDCIGISVAPESIVLTGFSITNLSNFAAPVNYRLIVSGPARLDDNGDAASLAGSTPELDAGQTWTPPSAGLILQDPLSPGLITVKYITAYAPALAIPETTRTYILIFDDATAVGPGPGGYRTALEQNFPNPSNPTTTIAFSLDAASRVKLTLYDVCGRFVKTLAGSSYPAGRYSVTWDGCDHQGQAVATGVYFYRMEAGAFSDTKKLLLLK